MQHITLQIISEILFGADVAGEERELGEALHLTFRHYAAAVTNPLHFPQNWPTPANRRAQQALARVHTTLDRLLANRLQPPDAHNDFLSLALQARSKSDQLTDAEIRTEALALFVAGHETTANALTWSITLLARHPDIAARLQSEGRQVLGQQLPTVTDLPRLPFALQVFQEALRLYPPVYAFTRRATISLQLGGYTIPRGSSIVVCPYTLHRRAQFFPHPEFFDPARFAPENAHTILPHTFIPFGAGPRICLGMHLALLEGQLILASLAQHCSFTLAENTPVVPEPLLTLRPEGTVRMKVVMHE
jgi:cytochrome P450